MMDGSVSACEADATATYCNTKGPFVFGPSGAYATTRLADDISTTGGAGRLLDRFVIRVTGDRFQDGSGTALGGYVVDYALYETCPNANVLPQRILGTEGSVNVSAEEAGDIIEIQHHVLSDEPLPASQLYLGMSFSRDLCGTVVGAPALKGFSDDRFDHPVAACNAWLGGFPGSAHASVYAEMYVREKSPDAFLGYRNSAQAELSPAENEQVRMADSFIVPRDCNVVGYEVAFHPAVIEVDLRPGPNVGGQDGPIFPGTRKQFAPCFDCNVQIGRVEVDPPIQLFAGQQHWVTFKSLTAGRGPILTCDPPQIGETANQYLAYSETAGQWLTRLGSSNCWYGFDLTLYCQGPPPAGACCDMIVKECVDGPNAGEPCANNVRCQPGTCESVCREVPELNCTGASFGAAHLWQEGATCGPLCTQGGAVGAPCGTDSDCSLCSGGTSDGEVCCPGGRCDLETDRCIGGERDGFVCCPFGDCMPGVCNGPFCAGGPRDGGPCTREADCPDGTCAGGPFKVACGLSACCTPFDGDDTLLAPCENLTANECAALDPPDPPRLSRYQIGKVCGQDDQECPIAACLTRRNVCLLEHDEPGCGDEFCCTKVCQQDPWCCDVTWDDLCVRAALFLCDRVLAPNDRCYDPDPERGATLLAVPDTVEGYSFRAAPDSASEPGEGADPGFCCHEENPGAGGVGTIWYKFVATETSAQISTCDSFSIEVDGVNYLAEDSLLAVYAVDDANRGICADGTACEVDLESCADGSVCVSDEQAACRNLMPIACNDNDRACNPGGPAGSQPRRSSLCVTDLVPGETYYVQVAGKSNARDWSGVPGNGIWRVDIAAPCSSISPPLHNDNCEAAEQLSPVGEDPLVIPFDLSGEQFGASAATVDCDAQPPFFCDLGTIHVDVWFDWTSPMTGTAVIATTGLHTALVVYRGCKCAVDEADFLGCSRQNVVTIPVVETGECYKIRLRGPVDDLGAGELKISVGPFCGNGWTEPDRGEVCDSGDGCTATCQCEPGWQPTPILSTDCEPICPFGSVTFIDPPAGTIDARQPFDATVPDQPLGIDTFTVSAPPGGLADCWTVSETDEAGQFHPGPLAPNGIENVEDLGDGMYLIELFRPIAPGETTTLFYRYLGPTTSGCFSSHPGNVNGDDTADAADIVALIDALNGSAATPISLYRYDIDHSGTVAPADLLRAIDLLLGAGLYAPGWQGTVRPQGLCP